MRGAQYPAVHIEGGLFSADLVSRVAAADRDLPGNKPEDYHLAAGERLGEAASRKWIYLLGAYRAFRDRIKPLPETEAGTPETREHWLLRLFDECGFGRVPYQRGGLSAREKSFPISHAWEHAPLHLIGWGVDLDHRSGPGERGRAPQSMMQEFLNTSDDHLWAVLSNGRQLRILRDSSALVGSAYIEFDLEAIFDGELYSDFALLFAFLHSSRFELVSRDDDSAPTVADCRLERWLSYAQETGIRAREQLRDGVEKALCELGTGFLEVNQRVSDDLAAGRLSLRDFNHELLRLVYQLIFLFVAEDRGALLAPGSSAAARERYIDYFSTQRLRRLADRRLGDRHTDLWRTLVIVLNALGSDEGRPSLALPSLGGLFFRGFDPLADGGLAQDLLRECALTNDRLLEAVRLLSTVRDRQGRRHRIDYQHLGAEELGSVYESLLELVPATEPGPRFVLRPIAGNDRKTTGSYYTPTSLIEQLLNTALDPVIAEHVASGDPADLMKITVCDPACGSGHFLVAAARRIAKRYAVMCHEEDEPSPGHVREAMHKVVASCVYGVDINPLAAELAKVSLWIESLEPGKPLAFLDAHIRVGNSLLGTTPELLRQGVPEGAFTAIAGDDKKIVTSLKNDNHQELINLRGGRGIQGSLFDQPMVRVGNRDLAKRMGALAGTPVNSVADVREQARRLRELRNSPELTRLKLVADAWCAAFVWRKHADAPDGITTSTLLRLGEGEGLRLPVAEELEDLVERYGFFHWHLEFPEVFHVPDEEESDVGVDPDTGWSGGFTCVLGNPPWERVKLQDQEFFAPRRPEIALAANAAARKQMISDLADGDDEIDHDLYADYQAEVRKSKAWSQLLRESKRYPLTGRGDINTYAVFAETARTIIDPTGRAGMVLPTNIATDYTPARFFRDLVKGHHLDSVFEFENEENIFPAVDHRVRFCLLTVGGRRQRIDIANLAFRARRVAQLAEKTFPFKPDQFLLVNPNTGNSPVCDTPRDARILLDIYEHVPVLWREKPHKNSWRVDFLRMYDMATDSGLFRTREQLEEDGWTLHGNVFTKDEWRMLPLYEAKMVHHFDHRYGTYVGQTEAQAKMGTLPRLTPDQRRNADASVLPRYWVQEFDTKDEKKSQPGKPQFKFGVRSRQMLKGSAGSWLIGWRDIARSTDERTMVSSAIPLAAVGHKFLLALAQSNRALLQANLCAIVLDYCVRQKFAGTSLAYFLVKQLPVLPPERYDDDAPWRVDVSLKEWVEPRVLELTYTAWDIRAFANDLGDDGPPFIWDDERRFWMRAELDAAYFHLYGVERDDVDYIMDSFRAFRNNDPERFARTKDAILQTYDAMDYASKTGAPYKTVLDPPPGEGPRHPAKS